MSESLPEDLVALLRQASLCFISTVMPDGSPQLTETWVDTDGARILINTVDGFQKVKNIRRDPRVAVAVADPEQPLPVLLGSRRGLERYQRRRRRAHRTARPALPRNAVSVVWRA